MYRIVRIALWFSVAGGAYLAAAWLPGTLGELEYFQAKEFDVVGNRFIGEKEILKAASIPKYASVFDVTDSWELNLNRHPLILSAKITRILPKTLVVTVQERVPIALVSNTLLEPVDRYGQILPLDPGKYKLDLPLLRTDSGTAKLSRSQLRLLATEVQRLTVNDPFFMAAVSEVSMDDNGDATFVVESDMQLKFRPPLLNLRLQEGLMVHADAIQRYPDRGPAIVDLRYADQVVVSYKKRMESR